MSSFLGEKQGSNRRAKRLTAYTQHPRKRKSIELFTLSLLQ
jgi:hypothetical protein